MKHLSQHMKSLLSGDVTTLCRCWRIERKDGVVLGLTDHDGHIEFQGTVYYSDSGMTPSALESSSDLAPDGMQIAGILGSPHLKPDDLQRGFYDDAEIQLWLVDWSRSNQGVRILYGSFGEIKQQGSHFVVNLEGPASILQHPVGRTYQKYCDAGLGDARCQVDISQNTFRTTSSVKSVEGGVITIQALNGFDNNWFSQGILKFTSGTLLGLEILIRSDRIDHSERRLTLWESLADHPMIHDTLQLTAGCDKHFETCKMKFSNVNNFRGMPHIPSSKLLISVAD